ncbi:uncharacterized protein LOC129980512 isoform X2 [Argiope bruennichi]|uniref:uncharacterized protein LOC129980512 isoform X2 n=1 Tax=Argiope bruennichi TaxID=94029 RepID=UPI0024949D45|nr:uncharacterized protein LOC129980512 isoform X2 [Argiope bruennichi]
MYRMLAIDIPYGLSSQTTDAIMYHFSKLMSKPTDVEKFIEAHRDISDFKILTQGISAGEQDDIIFEMFNPYIKELEKDTIQIDLSNAAMAVYQHATKEVAFNKFMRGDVQILEKRFVGVRDRKPGAYREL